MANDRIYIVCKFCGESELFYKFYPFTYAKGALRGYIKDPVRLDAFVTKHISFCHPNGSDTDLDGEPGFTFWCEGTEMRVRDRREKAGGCDGDKAG